MTITTWEYPDHTIHPTLPRTWGRVSGITPENAGRHGFTRIDTEVPDPPEVHTYSKLKLYDAMVEAGVWEQVKAAIEAAGQMERWDLAVDLATDYAPFAAILSQMRQAYGDELVDSILSQAEI